MMSLQEEQIEASIYFKEYINGTIKLNVGDYNRSVILSLNQVINYSGTIRNLKDINEFHLSIILRSEPEVILIGTGNKQTLPCIRIIAELAKSGKSADFMSSEQACKTYNLLVNENRNVSCIII